MEDATAAESEVAVSLLDIFSSMRRDIRGVLDQLWAMIGL